MLKWRGVFPAIATQFHEDGALDLNATVRHIERLRKSGVHGIIALGTVGENCSLEYHEKLQVLKSTIDCVAGTLPVLSGVAECTTHLACRFATDAAALGVDGLMV